MNSFSRPLMTIFIIFAMAYMLTIIGCGSSSNGPSADAAPALTVLPASEPKKKAPARPAMPEPTKAEIAKMPQCTDKEYETLRTWSFEVIAANKVMNSSSSKPSDQKLIQSTISSCDKMQAYHTAHPCKKSEVTTPELAKVYGAFEISKRCTPIKNYAVETNIISTPAPEPIPAPAPPKPVTNKPPVVATPPVTSPTAPPVAGMRSCSADEFAKLKSWRTAVDLANMNIGKLAGNLKFHPIAIDAATTATKACEPLMAYHANQPCQREKAYTSEMIRAQCQMARAYYYDFSQRQDTLIVPNAKLYLDTSIIANLPFRTEMGENSLYHNCRISNESANTVTYTGQKALVTETHVYSNSEIELSRSMFTMKTAEGLKFECYGLEYSSILTSKNEVVRLLGLKETKLPLFYELN
ncbi:MAG: hypothetical protein H7061_04655 [Bdellovibrionaceae bacterium]|nr:hypothetical protein [Bdellovibrio sp.]